MNSCHKREDLTSARTSYADEDSDFEDDVDTEKDARTSNESIKTKIFSEKTPSDAGRSEDATTPVPSNPVTSTPVKNLSMVHCPTSISSS